MKFEVLSEAETLAACQSFSIARFGDGELRLAIGGGCSSQQPDPKLASELRHILATYEGFVVGVPNFDATPRKDVWNKYRTSSFLPLFRQPTYGSSFITRPDNAPWIDTAEYWDAVRELWEGKDVTLVTGDGKSLTPAMLEGDPDIIRGDTTIENVLEHLIERLARLEGAASVRVVKGPRQHAYAKIDELEEEVGKPVGVVLLCLGATATALAARLARKGVHALDLGHIGMFMRHAGSFVPLETLISPEYLRQNQLLHADPRGFGGDGKKHAERVFEFAKKIGARSIIDYGCGEGTLKKAIVPLGWTGFFCEYDPAMKGKSALPKPAHLLACTDVLEHIEPDKLDAVLRHQFNVAELGAFMTIATRPANKVLPDGRNAHLIQESPQWWVEKLQAIGWTVVERFEKLKDGKCREVWLWLRKP